jgi:2-polyprenyl-3-methyl-5-hydroxy-6-metoxy-1,4-benzoquinol methylase
LKSHPVGRPHRAGFVDLLEVDETGLVRVLGWSTVGRELGAELFVNGARAEPFARYRTYRPDVARRLGSMDPFHGITLEYLARPASGVVEELELHVERRSALRLKPALRVQAPAYDHLFTTSQMLRRDDIYGSGPPADDVAEEVLALAASSPGPILDFGCGKGALVRRLRARGLDARGIEVDRPAIRDSLDAEMRAVIDLYDGRLPTAFANGSFESATCVEVLEHVARPSDVVAELARLVRRRLVATVPDMSAIPLCCARRVVPWHLLEATHVNFFTQSSFEALLRPHFRNVEMARICSDEATGTRFYTNLAAVCER